MCECQKWSSTSYTGTHPWAKTITWLLVSLYHHQSRKSHAECRLNHCPHTHRHKTRHVAKVHNLFLNELWNCVKRYPVVRNSIRKLYEYGFGEMCEMIFDVFCKDIELYIKLFPLIMDWPILNRFKPEKCEADCVEYHWMTKHTIWCIIYSWFMLHLAAQVATILTVSTDFGQLEPGQGHRFLGNFVF